MAHPIACPECEGDGYVREETLTGIVSHEMAIDAGDKSLEGQPIYEFLQVVCEYCWGSGWVVEE